MAKIIEDGVNDRVANEILIGMVTDDAVLGRIASNWRHKPFDCEWADIVGGWCVAFFQKHRKAPRKTIRSLYDQWAETQPSETLVKGVDQFLRHLSEQAVKQGEINSAHVLDIATRHFHKITLTRLRDCIEDAIEMGQHERADAKIAEFGKINLAASVGVATYDDVVAMRSAFHEREQPIVRYPGALGEMVNDAMTRSSFIAFEGPEKSGKSFYLIDLAFRAVTQRRKVAFFEVGDMSEGQVMLRFLARMARMPFRSPLNKWPFKVKYPETICPPERRRGVASVTSKIATFNKALDVETFIKRRDQYYKKHELPEQPMRMFCSPAGTTTVAGIISQLDIAALSGWLPDVVVIDYADLLTTVGSKKDEREQINSIWTDLRALSLGRNLLVATATQANADSYRTELIDRRNFSGDKRKLAHATGVIGINVSGKEKSIGVSRLNWIVRREGEYNWEDVVHCAGCLAVANPVIVSCF